MSGSNSHKIFGSFFTKQPYFWHSENEKWISHTMEKKTRFGKLVAHSNMQSFAQYEIIWETIL